jgi:hypothetical protein
MTWLAACRALGASLVGALVVAACEATDLSSLDNRQCPAGEKACFVNGAQQCVSTSESATGCGAASCVPCDVRVPNALTACSSTLTCSIAACNPGYLACNMAPSDGCEVDDQVDPLNCGLCGTVCKVPPGTESVPECFNGVCIISCLPGYGNCDGKDLNGCETPLGADPKNCGACDTACSAAQTCADGGCL